MRITRRDFMKYCAAAAGALGLSATDLIKLENALATDHLVGGTQVVWLNGAACTGCTVSLANTAYYSSIQDLLVPWVTAEAAIPASAATLKSLSFNGDALTDTGVNGPLDLVFMETLSSAVGHRALNAAKAVLTTHGGTYPFVLAIEGAIQTGSDGNFCRIGDGTTGTAANTISFADEVLEYATDANCLAILAVGTCASFGGIPAAKGSVTGARGLVSTGRISGGYTTVNNTGYWDYLKGTATYGIDQVNMANGGSGYTVAPTVSLLPGSQVGTGYSLTANISGGAVTGVNIVARGTGFKGNVVVVFTPVGGGVGASAIAISGINPDTGIDTDTYEALMKKTICVSGCPPHPDWIVGTIVYLVTYLEPPLMDKWHRPLDFYGQYQCTNCIWKTNTPAAAENDIDNNSQTKWTKGKVTTGNSPRLFKSKYNSPAEGCIGILGCKGRKTKADCSYRRWNTDSLGDGGISWCVQTRAGCHGCTEPRYPDGWGKFFSYV